MINLTDIFLHLGSGNPLKVKEVLRQAVLEGPGFEKLGKQTNIPPKSLMRMLSPDGNPTLNNLSLIIKIILRENNRTLAATLKKQSLEQQREMFLNDMAEKYFWWQRHNHEPLSKNRILAQVMDLGELSDTQTLHKLFDPKDLKDVLLETQPGWFHKKSWNYWNILLFQNHSKPLPERQKP